MNLINRIKDYIISGKTFSEELAIEITNFQLKNNNIYREFAKKKGILKVKSITEIPFLPVELFKKHKIFSFGEPEGFFISSGTTGNKSKVFYNKDSLELYRLSAIKSFPFKDKTIYSFIPPFSRADHSSLSFMINIFSKNFKVIYLNKNSFTIKPLEILNYLIKKAEEDSVVFLTAVQLLKIIEISKKQINKKFIFIETGGYKATGKTYKRNELYDFSKKIFINSEFYSEYGMAELFSQYYTVSEDKRYVFNHYNPILSSDGKVLVKVFDFANLGTVSPLLVPDLIYKEKDKFDIIGRIGSEIRGCGYVFK